MTDRIKCVWCPADATLRVDSGVFLCSACWERLADKIKIINPLTSVRDTADVVPAASYSPQPPSGAAGDNSACGGVESRHAASSNPGTPGTSRQYGKPACLGNEFNAEAGVAPGPQDSIQSPLASAMRGDAATGTGFSDRPIPVAVKFEYPEFPAFLRRAE